MKSVSPLNQVFVNFFKQEEKRENWRTYQTDIPVSLFQAWKLSKAWTVLTDLDVQGNYLFIHVK
jgi:hypothetical protein